MYLKRLFAGGALVATLVLVVQVARASMGVTEIDTALVLLVGFVALQEPLTVMRVLAIVLIAAGIFLLQAQGG